MASYVIYSMHCENFTTTITFIKLINKVNNKKKAKVFGTLLDGEWIKSKELMSF